MEEGKKISVKQKKLRNALFWVAWLPPLFAAIAKTFNYTFGTLTFLSIILTGHIGISLVLFSGPLLPIALCIALPVLFISLGMEGYALFEVIYGKLCDWLGLPRELEPEPSELDVNEKEHQQKSTPYVSSFVSACAWGLPLTAATSKGASAAAGTIATLVFILNAAGLMHTIVLSGVGGIVLFGIGLIAFLAVASVCTGKEGYTFYKHEMNLYQWIVGRVEKKRDQVKPSQDLSLSALKQSDECESKEGGDDLPEEKVNIKIRNRKWQSFLASSGSAVPPLVAALSKGFTYTFGALVCFNFFATGSFVVQAAMLHSPLFFLSLGLGLSVFLISWGMEGLSLQAKLSRFIHWLFTIEKASFWPRYDPKYGSVHYYIGRLVEKIINVVRHPVPLCAAACKGLSGAAAAMATLYFILHGYHVMNTFAVGSPVGIAIIVFATLAGLTIAGLSYYKEGQKFLERTGSIAKSVETKLAHSYQKFDSKKRDNDIEMESIEEIEKSGSGESYRERLDSEHYNTRHQTSTSSSYKGVKPSCSLF